MSGRFSAVQVPSRFYEYFRIFNQIDGGMGENPGAVADRLLPDAAAGGGGDDPGVKRRSGKDSRPQRRRRRPPGKFQRVRDDAVLRVRRHVVLDDADRLASGVRLQRPDERLFLLGQRQRAGGQGGPIIMPLHDKTKGNPLAFTTAEYFIAHLGNV